MGKNIGKPMGKLWESCGRSLEKVWDGDGNLRKSIQKHGKMVGKSWDHPLDMEGFWETYRKMMG
jgi:hypothetical protein